MKALGSPGPLRIGCGAGFSGDRWDAAVPVVRELAAGTTPAVLMYETLAERTLALAHLQRRADPAAGFEPTLERFLRPVLAACVKAGIAIVGNFGAANPAGAADCIQRLATSLGLPQLKVALVEGDDLVQALTEQQLRDTAPAGRRAQPLVSANAYLGAFEIAAALQAGAQVVVTGRVADPSLALGPIIAHFGWAEDDWDRLACGTMAGHLLECGAQVCGGYFADPGVKDVPDLANVGFPIVEIRADGSFVVGKPPGTGGRVDRMTVTEQLLYEVHDPAAYLTPDVIADLTETIVEPCGINAVQIRGVRGKARPATLKATLCYEGGWIGEGEISYAGPNAEARARLAGEVVRQRMQYLGHGDLPLRIDLVGVTSVLADDAGHWWDGFKSDGTSADVRLRVAIAAPCRETAELLAREVTALYTCGPAAGGGVRTNVNSRLQSDSAFIPREWLRPAWRWAT